MKLLFGLAVAILVLATTLEVVNADIECLDHPKYKLHTNKWNMRTCYWKSKDAIKYAQAAKNCRDDDGFWRSLTVFPDLTFNDMFWEKGKDPDEPHLCQTISNGKVGNSNCEAEHRYICRKLPVCRGTIKSDPLVNTGDGANYALVGQGTFELIQYENQTEKCKFNVKIHTTGSTPVSILIDRVEISIADGTYITINETGSMVDPEGVFYPYDANATGVVFERLAVLDAAGNITDPGYQLSIIDSGAITFQVDECYQSMEIVPHGNYFDVSVSLVYGPHEPLTGIFGNFDGDPDNDLVDADGNDISNDRRKNIIMSNRFLVDAP